MSRPSPVLAFHDERLTLETGVPAPATEHRALDLSRSGLVGRSAPMVAVYRLIAQAARTNAAALITGETGTGKELVARAIHDLSTRAARPFLSANCSGLPDTLLESELFGHIRGAFAGAIADRRGLLEAADGGTLLLDGLASASPSFQARLLRVLECGEVRRVGSAHNHLVNVRIVVASSAPLRELVAAGKFRADLYYRLSVVSIELPPLRSRLGDVEILAAHFLRRLEGAGHPVPRLAPEALEALCHYSFPGNVRELENALRQAATLAAGGNITLDCLPVEMAGAGSPARSEERGTSPQLVADRPSMDELQRRYLQFILEENGWNRRRTASVLELDRRTIQRLIARYQLRGIPDLEEAQSGTASPCQAY